MSDPNDLSPAIKSFSARAMTKIISHIYSPHLMRLIMLPCKKRLGVFIERERVHTVMSCCTHDLYHERDERWREEGMHPTLRIESAYLNSTHFCKKQIIRGATIHEDEFRCRQQFVAVRRNRISDDWERADTHYWKLKSIGVFLQTLLLYRNANLMYPTFDSDSKIIDFFLQSCPHYYIKVDIALEPH